MAAAKRKSKPPANRTSGRPMAKVCKGCTSTRIYTRSLCALCWCSRADLADPVPPPRSRRIAPEPLASAVVRGRG